MKILESQSAVLTNFEVSRFLHAQKIKYQGETPARRMPPNMNTLVKEVQLYLGTFPNPLHEPPAGASVSYTPGHTYTDESVRNLVFRLAPYNVTKAEMTAILNMRPESMVLLVSILEDADERWTASEQEEILDIITSVLGRFPDELRAYHTGEKQKAQAEDDEAE